jgi:hypothetical protein
VNLNDCWLEHVKGTRWILVSPDGRVAATLIIDTSPPYEPEKPAKWASA